MLFLEILEGKDFSMEGIARKTVKRNFKYVPISMGRYKPNGNQPRAQTEQIFAVTEVTVFSAVKLSCTSTYCNKKKTSLIWLKYIGEYSITYLRSP